MSRYALKGINDEETVCSVCGKVELRRVMWIVELDNDGNEVGEAIHCGTTCGAKLLKSNVAKVRKAADGFAANVQNKRDVMAEMRLQRNGGYDLLRQLNELGMMTFHERKAHPLMRQYNEIKAEAQEWAKAQPIVIEL